MIKQIKRIFGLNDRKCIEYVKVSSDGAFKCKCPICSKSNIILNNIVVHGCIHLIRDEIKIMDSNFAEITFCLFDPKKVLYE